MAGNDDVRVALERELSFYERVGNTKRDLGALGKTPARSRARRGK